MPQLRAPLDVRNTVSDSGWAAAPRLKNMTEFQFPGSTCQVEGEIVPVADFNLAAGDGVYFAHHVLLRKDSQVRINRMPLQGAFTRAMAGMPVIMTDAERPGHIAFSRDEPGEVIALPLQHGQGVDVRAHHCPGAARTPTAACADPHRPPASIARGKG